MENQHSKNGHSHDQINQNGKHHDSWPNGLKELSDQPGQSHTPRAGPGIKWGNVAEVSIPRGHNALWKARLR